MDIMTENKSGTKTEPSRVEQLPKNYNKRKELDIDPGYSDFRITPSGISVGEHWDVYQDIYARVKEISSKGTVLQCIIDPELKSYQDRIFDTKILSKLLNLKIGCIVLIKQRQGFKGNEYQNLISFSDGNGLLKDESKYFPNTINVDNIEFDPKYLGDILR
jgi:hypothetical protein